ncbi:adenosylcobinamide-GDP ribazoletransferase [uncultured Endozoicomonas sp.]|uniref:adenosylcobinamide-GDP ribazoletransferase n=1 Tax=uncultured Endozoicomonas sp. TaxID=432652 RepID=UPI00342B34F4
MPTLKSILPPPLCLPALTIIAITLIFRSLFKRWIIKRIGGFTGDCLGAAQQLSELLIYLILIATMA